MLDRNDLNDMIDRILEKMDGAWDPEDEEEELGIEDDDEECEYEEEEIVSIGSFEDKDIIGLANFSTEIYVGAKEERPVDWNSLW